MEDNNLSQPTQPLPAPVKKWYQHKGIITVVVLAIIAGTSVWVYLTLNQPQNLGPIVINHLPKATQANPSQQVQSSTATSTPSNPSGNQATLAPWPQLPDLHLFSDNCDPNASPTSPNACQGLTFAYYDISTAVSNLGAGKKLILFDCGCAGGIGESYKLMRFLQNGNSYTLLQKYSFPLTDLLTEFLEIQQGSFAIDNTFDIPALDAPKQITDPNSGAVIDLAVDPAQVSDFFDSSGTPIFTDSSGRQIFAQTGPQNEGFNVASADGINLTYELSDPFISNEIGGYFTSTLDIKWNDGQTHNNNFQFDPAGDSNGGMDICLEGPDYVKTVSSTTISQNDLIAVGTNASGQPIYGFKDPNNPILKAAEAQVQALGNKAHNNPVDIIIFWKDPFGRLIRFVSSDMLDVCGA